MNNSLARPGRNDGEAGILVAVNREIEAATLPFDEEYRHSASNELGHHVLG
jgi:hypothetical protein